jgi:hypothetical protein
MTILRIFDENLDFILVNGEPRCLCLFCHCYGKATTRNYEEPMKHVIFGVPTYAHISCVAEFYKKAKIVPNKKTEDEKE